MVFLSLTHHNPTRQARQVLESPFYDCKDRNQEGKATCPRSHSLMSFESTISKSKFSALCSADSGIALKTSLDDKTSNYSTNVIGCLLCA